MASVTAVMMMRRLAVGALLLVMLGAAAPLAARHPTQPTSARRHSIAVAIATEPDGDACAGWGAAAAGPALARSPLVDRAERPRSRRLLQRPPHDPIPVRHRKGPSREDDPFPRG